MSFDNTPPTPKDLSAGAFSNTPAGEYLAIYPFINVSGGGEGNGDYALDETAGVPDLTNGRPTWSNGAYTLRWDGTSSWEIHDGTIVYDTDTVDAIFGTWTIATGTGPAPTVAPSTGFTNVAPTAKTIA